MKDIMRCEIYTTHMENLLRADMGLPLRTHYGLRKIGNDYVGVEPIIYPGIKTSRYVDVTGKIHYYGLPISIVGYKYK